MTASIQFRLFKDEYEKISSSQSSEPIFALDDLEQQRRRRRPHRNNKPTPSSPQPAPLPPRQADDQQLRRRRRNYRDQLTGDDQAANGTAVLEQQPQRRQSCYYRIMTAADSDDNPLASATPRRSDSGAGEEDSTSSSGGGGGGAGSAGQKRRLTRSSSPLAVVTREIYVDTDSLLLGNQIARAASLGAIGVASVKHYGALSIAMSMEAANSQSGQLAMDLVSDVGVHVDVDFASSSSTDGSLADESSVGQSSNPPSPAPPIAPASTPTGAVMPPAMSASATATFNRIRHRNRPHRRRSRDDFSGQRPPQPLPRLLDARRLASRAERYFTRSAGQLCASAVGFLSQEDHSGLECEEECPSSSGVEGPEDLDQLWDHYQPQPYLVGADEAAEEKLDDSHLQWEADQQQFDSAAPGREQKRSSPKEHRVIEATATSASPSTSESASASEPESESTPHSAPTVSLVEASRFDFANLSTQLRRCISSHGVSDGDEGDALAAEAAQLAQLTSLARHRLDELLLVGDTEPDNAASASLAADWDSLASYIGRLSDAFSALAMSGASLVEMRANGEAMQSRLRSACLAGRLADRIRLLRDYEASLHSWLGVVAGLHSQLESVWCAAEFAASKTAERLPDRLVQIRQCRLDQIKLLTNWLASMRESCGSRLFSLLRGQERLQQVEFAVAECERAIADEVPHRLRRCASEWEALVSSLSQPMQRDQLAPLANEIQACLARCSELDSSVSLCRHQLADLDCLLGGGSGGSSSDERLSDDIGDLDGRLNEVKNRAELLHEEAAQLLSLIGESIASNRLQSSSCASAVSTGVSSAEVVIVGGSVGALASRLAGVAASAAATVGGGGLPGVLMLLGCCCCLLLLLMALLRAGTADWQLVSVSQPNGAPY